MKFIDDFLNRTTMYNLVLRGLFCLAAYGIILSFFGVISYNPWSMIQSLIVVTVVSFCLNWILARLYGANPNWDSTLITALILFLILLPSAEALVSITLVSILAVASKYVLSYKHRHIFNPAAVGALAAGYMSTGSALWWVGSTYMLIGVAILAFLVVKKTRRFALFFSAVLSSFITVGILSFVNHLSLTDQLSAHLLSWPIIFFASIMITEPLSTPATRKLQVIYSLGVGTLSAIPFSFGPIYNTPQLALLVGNIFAFIVGMKERLTLYLVSKVQIARDTYEFVFKTSSKLHYIPGQYLEYVLPHAKPDSRGIRRYFTIASSPTEAELKLGIRMAPANGSSFKKALMNMNPSQTMIASRLAGDFTMPAESTKKLVFIAGGIGITPFRSMVQYLLDTKTKRDIVIFYANKTPDDIAYSDLWSRAENELGIKVVHVMAEVYVDWRGESGFITADMVKKYVGDHIHATYYISGPTGMVNAYKKLLRSMSVSRSSIVTDYFPGFA